MILNDVDFLYEQYGNSDRIATRPNRPLSNYPQSVARVRVMIGRVDDDTKVPVAKPESWKEDD